MACCGPPGWLPGQGAPDHSDRLASRMLPAGAVPGLGGTGLARSCEQARAARGERPVNAPGESGRVISQASARVWDAYDAAVREAQAGVMESAGRWPLSRQCSGIRLATHISAGQAYPLVFRRVLPRPLERVLARGCSAMTGWSGCGRSRTSGGTS